MKLFCYLFFSLPWISSWAGWNRWRNKHLYKLQSFSVFMNVKANENDIPDWTISIFSVAEPSYMIQFVQISLAVVFEQSDHIWIIQDGRLPGYAASFIYMLMPSCISCYVCDPFRPVRVLLHIRYLLLLEWVHLVINIFIVETYWCFVVLLWYVACWALLTPDLQWPWPSKEPLYEDHHWKSRKWSQAAGKYWSLRYRFGRLVEPVLGTT